MENIKFRIVVIMGEEENMTREGKGSQGFIVKNKKLSVIIYSLKKNSCLKTVH